MGFRKIYLTILSFGGVLCSTNSLAQQTDSVFFDVNYVRQSNAWLSSKNAAGLKYFSLPKMSSAQLSFNKADGDFRNYHQSTDSYDFGLQSESLYRLNTDIVFSGSILYKSFSGQNMAGSGFIDPYQTPFDIVEGRDVNRGRKKQEVYKLSGKVSAQLSSRFTIGGGLEYESSNFAKMKDLRHINKLLDIDATFGGLYQINRYVEFGLNYSYLRRIESVGFRSYSNKDDGFESLISFGAFYGRPETFGKSGYTSSENTWPLTDVGHSVSMQLYLRLNEKMKLFNEFSYANKSGYFGPKRTSGKPFTEHQSINIMYSGIFSILKGKNEHLLSLNANYGSLLNTENTERTQTAPGGVESISIFLQSEVLDRQQLKANLKYTLFKNVSNNNPVWVFNANIDYYRRQQTINFLYPFYRDQTINSYQANVNLKRNIVKADKVYSYALGLGYGGGNGIAKFDGLHTAPTSNSTPVSMDLYLYQEFEYFTKPRVMADLSLQYTKKLKQNIAPYAKLNYNYTKAFDIQFLGSGFGVAGASIGCNF